MGKLNFNPNPTFKLTVKIPVPGADAGELTMEFKHLHPTTWNDLRKKAEKDMEDAKGDQEKQLAVMVQAIKELAVGWAWEQEFNDENIAVTLLNYPAFYASVQAQYAEELWNVRVKN